MTARGVVSLVQGWAPPLLKDKLKSLTPDPALTIVNWIGGWLLLTVWLEVGFWMVTVGAAAQASPVISSKASSSP